MIYITENSDKSPIGTNYLYMLYTTSQKLNFIEIIYNQKFVSINLKAVAYKFDQINIHLGRSNEK
jgi:hypothetical protein